MFDTGDEPTPSGDPSDSTPQPPAKDFGDQLSAWRRARGLTISEVASRADVSDDLVERIEASDHEVGIFDIFSVARALGLKSASFDFGFDQDPPTTQGMLFVNIEFEDE